MFPFDATNIEPFGGYAPIPVGSYHCVIEDVAEGRTKAGDAKVDVRLVVDEGEYLGRRLFNTVTFLPRGAKGAGFSVHFLKTIGELWQGDLEVEPENWIGRRLLANVVIDEWNGKKNNKVSSIEPITDGKVESTEMKQQWLKNKKEKAPF